MYAKRLSLIGLRILNTRPLLQGYELNTLLEQAGATVIHIPALEIVSLEFMHLLPNLSTVSCAIFISANAVEYFYQSVFANMIAWPQHIKIVAIGQATAEKLSMYNLVANCVPLIANSENLLNLPELQLIDQEEILLIKGVGGLNLIMPILTKRGAHVIALDVYQRIMPAYNAKLIKQIWQQDTIDIILFTSQEAIYNIFTMFGDRAKSWLQNKACIVISERLALSAQAMGIKSVIVCKLSKIIQTLQQCIRISDEI